MSLISHLSESLASYARSWGVDPSAFKPPSGRKAGLAAMLVAATPLLAACPGSVNPPPEGPRVSIVSPIAGREYASPLEVALEASSPVGIDSVRALLDGSEVCAWEGDASSYECSVPAPAGSRSLEAIATDSGGARASRSVSFSISAPTCEVNPIEQVALDAGVPYEWVRALGEDCEVDADEQWFVSDFLPELRSRTTDRIAETYRKFILDDGELEADERLVLSRYFEGRRNHEGVKINPGYFELVDANIDNAETRLAIANAEWVPLFVTPFANRVIPGYQNNGYGEPYYPDGGLESMELLFLPNRGGDRSFLDLLGSALQPQPDVTITDASASSQFIFAQDQALVVDAPHAMVVDRIQELDNYGLDGTMIRNATLYLSPVSRSPSLRFPDLSTSIVHADLSRLLVEEGDIVLPEQLIAYSELRLGGGIQVKWSHRSADGHVGEFEQKAIDSWEPSFSDSSRRGMVLETALYRAVDADGNPTSIFYGTMQRMAVKDGRGMTLDGTWDPLIWTKP